MRPFGPVPRKDVTSTPRSLATRRAFGETNSRPPVVPLLAPLRLDVTTSACEPGGTRAPGSPTVSGSAASATGGARPPSGSAGPHRAAARPRSSSQPINVPGGRSTRRSATGWNNPAPSASTSTSTLSVASRMSGSPGLTALPGCNQPLLDRPGLHGQAELGKQNLDGHVSLPNARASCRTPPAMRLLSGM